MAITRDIPAQPHGGPMTAQRLKGRIALVTGASRGIGRAVAAHYAEEGAQVIALARTQGALEELDDTIRGRGQTPPVLIPADLARTKDIAGIGAALHERFGRLDVLLGNAAILGDFSPIAHHDPATWKRVMRTNLDANYHLIQAMHPLLKASDAGRAIFVTSGLARSVMAYGGAYAVSKAALEMMVKLYAAENEDGTLRVNLLDPGVVRTRMRAAAFPGEDPATLPRPQDVTEAFVQLAMMDCTRHGETVHAGDFA